MSEIHDILCSFSSSFASKDDLTCYLFNDNIKFDPSIFENHLSAASSDLELVNSTNCEDFLHECDLEESNLNVLFEPFIMPQTEDTIFTDNFTTSSFVKDIIETSSREIKQKNKRILNFI